MADFDAMEQWPLLHRSKPGPERPNILEPRPPGVSLGDIIGAHLVHAPDAEQPHLGPEGSAGPYRWARPAAKLQRDLAALDCFEDVAFDEQSLVLQVRSMAKVYPRWKEELVWESGRERLVFEFTMGVSHVYFPTIEKWRSINPELTAPHYGAVLGDIRA